MMRLNEVEIRYLLNLPASWSINQGRKLLRRQQGVMLIA